MNKRAVSNTILYGEAGVGKTSFFRFLDKMTMILSEKNNSYHIPLSCYVKNWNDFLKAFSEAKTPLIVIDNVSDLMFFLSHNIMGTEPDNTEINMNTWGGGYGAFSRALESNLRLFVNKFVIPANERGQSLVFIAHQTLTNEEDTTTGDKFISIVPTLFHKKAEDIFKKFVDNIFILKKMIPKPTAENSGLPVKGRVLKTSERTGFWAKNRFNLKDDYFIEEGKFDCWKQVQADMDAHQLKEWTAFQTYNKAHPPAPDQSKAPKPKPNPSGLDIEVIQNLLNEVRALGHPMIEDERITGWASSNEKNYKEAFKKLTNMVQGGRYVPSKE